MLVLQILGGIFVVVIVVCLFFAYKIFRWYRNNIVVHTDTFKLLDVLPPIRFEMFGVEFPRWESARYVQDAESLESLGFERCGCFEAYYGVTRAQFDIWLKSGGSVCALLYEATTPIEGQTKGVSEYAADFFVNFVDGSSLTIGNSKHAGALPRPDKDTLIYRPENDLAELFKSLKHNIPSNKKLRAIADAPKTALTFMQQYHAWLWEEPQLKSDKMAALVAPMGIELTVERVEVLLEHAQEERSDMLSEKVLSKVAGSVNMSLEQWESFREGLVVVHDLMNGSQLSDCFYQLVEQHEEADEDVIDSLTEQRDIASPTALFEDTLQTLKAANRIKRIAQIKDGVSAQVYMVKPFSG